MIRHSHHHRAYAAQPEHIAVRAAAGRAQVGRQPQLGERAFDQLQRRLARRQVVRRELRFEMAVYDRLRIHAANLRDGFIHLHADSVQRLDVAAAELAANGRQLRDGVPHSAAFYGADVESGFVVQPPLRKAGDDFRRDSDCGQPLLRLRAGVGGPPGYVYVEPDVLRAGCGYLAWGALAVENHRLRSGQHGEIKVARADKPYLFLPRERHFDGAALDAVFGDGLQRLYNRGDARFAIPAEDGRPVRDDALAVHRRLDAAPRLHGVHVRGQDERVAVRAVAAVAVVGDDVAVCVPRDFQAHLLKPRDEELGDGFFLPGRAVDSG